MKYRGEGAIRIGVSSCLLGEEVRFDKGHKRSRFVADVLGDYVEFVSVCPEVEAGLGLPRPSMRLVREGELIQVLEVQSRRDHTAALERHAKHRVAALRRMDLVGYVLKSGSPSCGMERVKIYTAKGPAKKEGRGVFAGALQDALPLLPVEEEGRLNDDPIRENFIERVFGYRRLRDLFAGRWTPRQVVEFHTAHKLQLMAHSPQAYRELGRLVAGVKKMERSAFREAYERGFMEALAKRATKGRNTNVLQHMAGYLREALSADEKVELQETVEDYRLGLVPLIVPVTLMRHHVRRQGVAYLAGQVYLGPHPKELMLRNHV
ncbi:MAG: YbgA family protein [Myxococcota bacterium]